MAKSEISVWPRPGAAAISATDSRLQADEKTIVYVLTGKGDD
jgi:hypothetical protein